MLARLVEKYGEIIQSWSVTLLDKDGPSLRLRAQVTFIDSSVLYIRPVVIRESTFKYSYHWQDQKGSMICRWDNAEHWPKIPTYPHHRHAVNQAQIIVKESHGGDLVEVFEEITEMIRSEK